MDIPTFDEVKQIDTEVAFTLLDELAEKYENSDSVYVVRGRLYWSLNKRKEAINDYLKALTINPQSEAKKWLEFSYNILDYYNKDLLNP